MKYNVAHLTYNNQTQTALLYDTITKIILGSITLEP